MSPARLYACPKCPARFEDATTYGNHLKTCDGGPRKAAAPRRDRRSEAPAGDSYVATGLCPTCRVRAPALLDFLCAHCRDYADKDEREMEQRERDGEFALPGRPGAKAVTSKDPQHDTREEVQRDLDALAEAFDEMRKE